jgi:hypothetical protein
LRNPAAGTPAGDFKPPALKRPPTENALSQTNEAKKNTQRTGLKRKSDTGSVEDKEKAKIRAKELKKKRIEERKLIPGATEAWRNNARKADATRRGKWTTAEMEAWRIKEKAARKR